MARLALLHFDPAGVAVRASKLLALGHGVTLVSPRAPEDVEGLLADPPDAFLLDLDRRPSHGRELGAWLRRRKGTRHVPLAFLGGTKEAVERARALLPDAAFGPWEDPGPVLDAALSAPPARPAVPGAMAGYSGTPLPRKLGIRAGHLVVLSSAPAGFARALAPLPDGARVASRLRAGADVLVLFAPSRRRLSAALPRAIAALARGGKLWVAWPKKASGVRSDLAEREVRAAGLACGLVDYKIAALDATWSGLCFARRAGEGRRPRARAAGGPARPTSPVPGLGGGRRRRTRPPSACRTGPTSRRARRRGWS